MSDDRLTSESLDTQANTLITYLKSMINVSDYEANILKNSFRNINLGVPSTKLLLSESIDSFISLKSNLSYLKLKINDYRRTISIPYNDLYNQGFVRLTKALRPSKQAIDSELHYTDPKLREYRDKLSDIDNLLEFIDTMLLLIDRKVDNMNARRYDMGN